MPHFGASNIAEHRHGASAVVYDDFADLRQGFARPDECLTQLGGPLGMLQGAQRQVEFQMHPPVQVVQRDVLEVTGGGDVLPLRAQSLDQLRTQREIDPAGPGLVVLGVDVHGHVGDLVEGLDQALADRFADLVALRDADARIDLEVYVGQGLPAHAAVRSMCRLLTPSTSRMA